VRAALKARRSYTVRIGNTGLGLFHDAGCWEGLQKLQNDKGQSLILLKRHAMSEVLSEITDTEEDAQVLMMSPALVDQLLPEDLQGWAAAPAGSSPTGFLLFDGGAR
jgi:hypothetical protein